LNKTHEKLKATATVTETELKARATELETTKKELTKLKETSASTSAQLSTLESQYALSQQTLQMRDVAITQLKKEGSELVARNSDLIVKLTTETKKRQDVEAQAAQLEVCNTLITTR